ncbi:hypothetical protein DSAG12_03358 [Promethearchaeum syntrophicum]|uniref:Uncharacterized protein n=1 Tax=Promethearchaeum syntrophicum TaxID=2594042 RepID=A0A5B9DET6_9ARCH|nr:hypothetical protein [Candidatus Prometheoarchaeum syntrophicum]
MEDLCNWNDMPHLEDPQHPIKAIIAGMSALEEAQRESFKPKIDIIVMEGHGHCMLWADHETFNTHLQQMISDILND